ncbi:MAG: DNA internalization-related competence protein ComEC/Rec2 [Burkholderiales bacterium]|nr:DNA internalization-related competence protein ComEC/Rec2 [Burkholderiales bacterium]
MPQSQTQSKARLLTPALLGWISGLALQLQQSELWPAAHYGLLIAAALALFLVLNRLHQQPARLLFIFVATALLAHASTGLRALHFQQQALDPALEGQDVRVTGRISAMPQFGENSTRFRYTVESATQEGQTVQIPPQLYLSWYGSWRNEDGALLEPTQVAPALQAGERWQFTVRLRAPHGARNPHGFDFELWLWEQGLQATGYVRTGRRDPQPRLIEQSGKHPVEWARQQVRDAIQQRAPVVSGSPTEEAQARAMGIVAALVTGDQQAITRSDWDVFRATGVAHLMSISGLHITLFAWLAALLLRALWRTSPRLCLAFPAQHAGLLGGLLLAASYALFSGWGVPAQRTVLMLATVTLLRLSARRWPWPQLWLLAAAVVLAADPWALLQAGFWLSFVAVGVLFAGAGRETPEAPRTLRQHLWGLLREQWLITLALAPLTLLLFGQVSLVSLLANVLAIPWVTLLVTPLSLLGLLWAPLWDAAAQTVQWLGWALGGLASLPLATFSVAQAPLWAGVAGVLGGLLLVLRLPWAMRFAGLPLLLPVLLWQAPRPAPGQFDLLAVDIGQGNAVLVRTAGHALLYDAGPRYANDSDAGQRVLVPLLRALDVRLDRLVLSHRDSDHTGGGVAVLSAQPDADLLSSLEDAHELQTLRRSRRCMAGQVWDWDGVHFEVLHPPAGDYGRARRSNALSCVLRISNGLQTALLAGDIEKAQEARLVQEGAALRADWLLVPHHGSKTSSTAAFLDAVAPHTALVQAGYRNRFGHPAAEVTARYEERGVQVLNSAQCGAARWGSEQPRQTRCQREMQARYWQHRPQATH